MGQEEEQEFQVRYLPQPEIDVRQMNMFVQSAEQILASELPKHEPTLREKKK